jgi:hypothetical protein
MADAVFYMLKDGVARYFVGAQNTRIWTANILIGIHPAPAQNGSARGYQSEFALSAAAE